MAQQSVPFMRSSAPSFEDFRKFIAARKNQIARAQAAIEAVMHRAGHKVD